jgi:large subunit ribosomal protein L4
VLILTDGLDEALYLAARNLYGVIVMSAQEVDPVSLVAFDTLLATEAAVKKLEERLA